MEHAAVAGGAAGPAGLQGLLISKGDANYRRLLGDLHWPYDTAPKAVLEYLPWRRAGDAHHEEQREHRHQRRAADTGGAVRREVGLQREGGDDPVLSLACL